MKQRLLASGVVFLVGFGIGLGVTYALLAKKPEPAPQFAANEGDAGEPDLSADPDERPDRATDDTTPKTDGQPTDGTDAKPRKPVDSEGAGEAREAGTVGSNPGTATDGGIKPANPEGAGEVPEQPGADGGPGLDDGVVEPSDGTDGTEPAAAPADGTNPEGTEAAGTGDDGTANGIADEGTDDSLGDQSPPSDGPWWEGLAGRVCSVDLGRARVLTIRKGDLKDGDVLDWKGSFGRNQRIGSLFKDDAAQVTVHGVAVNAAGTPVAAKITLDKKGRETTGIIALHTQGLKVTLLPIDAAKATP
ncbi:MAG: hypothetical protein ACI9OJ_001072 [Myxococcota bacterium]|jgi:hypothetical protein